MSSKQLICQFTGCKLILENPVTMPCSNSICKHHLEQVEQSDHKYNCFLCQEQHEIPINGFSINKSLDLMIQNYYESDPIRKKIMKLFVELNNSVKEYNSIIPGVYIYDYFAEIRNQVDLHREELIKKIYERSKEIDEKYATEINKRSAEIIRKLNEKEDDCVSNATKIERNNFDQLKSVDLTLWKCSLRITDLKQEQLTELLSIITEKLAFVRDEIKQFKNSLLLNETVLFDKYENDCLFGKLSFHSNKNNILSKDCGDIIRSFEGSYNLINSIKVDEKSNRLICGCYDEKIRIWNFETGKCLKTLNDHDDSVSGILILPNNRFISGSWDKRIKVWCLDSYKCLKTFKNESEVWCLCSLPNNQIACGCENGAIHIWCLTNLKKVKSFKAHSRWTAYMVANETQLISSGDKKIRIWNLKTFECIKVLKGVSSEIYCLELALDGYIMSSSAEDKSIKLWQIESGEISKSFQFETTVCCFKVLDDNLIAVALDSRKIHIYDIKKMETIKTLSSNTVIASRYCFSNGNLIVDIREGNVNVLKIFD